MIGDEFDEQKDAYQKKYSHLLAVLQKKRGQWMTRREIVKALRMTQFSSSLILGVQCLESVGLIESRRIAYKRWEYRALPE